MKNILKVSAVLAMASLFGLTAFGQLNSSTTLGEQNTAVNTAQVASNYTEAVVAPGRPGTVTRTIFNTNAVQTLFLTTVNLASSYSTVSFTNGQGTNVVFTNNFPNQVVVGTNLWSQFAIWQVPQSGSLTFSTGASGTLTIQSGPLYGFWTNTTAAYTNNVLSADTYIGK